MSGFLLMVVGVLILWRLLPHLLRGADGIAGLAGEGGTAVFALVLVLCIIFFLLLALALTARGLQ